jgi:HAD superfamily hydrolase (TIGR01509 family)
LKLVIFDCDGVLVDSEGPVNELLLEDLNGRGLSLRAEDMRDLFVGGTMEGVFRQARSMGGDLPDDWVARFYEKMFARLSQGVPLIDGVLDLISAVEASGASIWVASNGPYQKMRHTLMPHGLWDRFEGRIMSREDFAPKPAPDMILHAMKHSDAGPSETAFIDDSPTGCAAGIAAGVRTIGYAEETPAEILAKTGAEPVFSMGEIRILLGL